MHVVANGTQHYDYHHAYHMQTSHWVAFSTTTTATSELTNHHPDKAGLRHAWMQCYQWKPLSQASIAQLIPKGATMVINCAQVENAVAGGSGYPVIR